ncbi:MAG: DNA cytosine methyltransferase [Clostridiales Family XIII bacterium]|nr:DNA cytosine methyltransferase [Clostridiales Family XIII bacterium]
MNIVSLFSGAGGLDLGLMQAGHKMVWANDFDADAVRTYKHNIDSVIMHADINNVSVDDIPAADAIVGGFPCQGFSLANMNRNVDDERNQLYKAFCRIVSEKKPNYFVAENVKGILSLGGGAVIEHIKNEFERIGYRVNVHSLNLADYGIPQTRQRVLILGQRKDLGPQISFSAPAPTHSRNGYPLPWVSIKEAIDRFPSPDEPNTVLNHTCSAYKVAYRNFTGHRMTDPDKPSPTILARGNGKGGVCAIPHYNGERRLTIRESAAVQTFPDDFEFFGGLGSCYRQIGNAVPVAFGKLIGNELFKAEKLLNAESSYYEDRIAI